jgi:predicted PurR-regulated permease PerM
MPEQPAPPQKIELTVSWATILKVAVAGLLIFLTVKLWPLLALLLLALLVAITLFPILRWTRRRGWPDWTGILSIALLLFVSVGLFAGFLIPTLGDQASEVIRKMPAFQKDFIASLPGPLQDGMSRLFESVEPEVVMKQGFEWGTLAVQGLAQFLIILVLAVYLVADGERVFRWLLAFLPERHRRKVNEASPEIASVVSSYMIGQLITSLLCGIYAFTILSLLRVPNAALLAVIAAAFDILPIIGFVLALIPALLIAVSVSSGTAGLVLVLYVAYHLLESYFIVPRIYGNRLRLSTLTVLVSCMAAALVAGIVGAIAILPVVASYPIIERIWLRRHLEADTISTHAQILEEEHPRN